MKQTKTTKIALVSLLTALSVVLGYFLKIPTPTGILTLLDAGVFFAAFYFGSREGAIVGGLAGFLIDLLSGYPQWMFFSLVNHGLQGFFAGFKGKGKWLGLVLATVAMVGGYALGSTLMNGWACSPTRNSSQLFPKYSGDDCRIYFEPKYQEDKVKS